MNTAQKRKHSEEGATVVEVALSFVVVLALMGSIIDLGGHFYASYYVSHALRAGARQAAVDPALESNIGATQAAIKTQIDENTSLSHVTVNVSMPYDIENPEDKARQVVVKADAEAYYRYAFLSLLGLKGSTLSRSTSIRYEYSGAPG